MNELYKNLESLRIDIDSECQYRDPIGVLRDKYERANEMLDDCIEYVREYFDMNKIQDVDSFGESPITYYTHLSDDVVVSPTCVYINGICVFRIREPNDGVRGIRSSIGIYDNTVTQDEVEQLIRPKCGKVFKTNY